MNPAMKRFYKRYGDAADMIALADIDQEERERMAEALADRLDGQPDFRRDLFVLIASDPLCECIGAQGAPCPDEVKIRIPMHLSSAPDGRSQAWRERKPEVRCISCGSRERFEVKTHVCICDDCEIAPYEDRCKFEAALADMWALYGGECEHGVGLDRCARCDEDASEDGETEIHPLNELRPTIAAACGVQVESAP